MKSIEKLLSDINNLKRSIKRDGPKKYEDLLDTFYVFPKYEESKKVPKVRSTDLLDLNPSF